jgi:hypothetical protein
LGNGKLDEFENPEIITQFGVAKLLGKHINELSSSVTHLPYFWVI